MKLSNIHQYKRFLPTTSFDVLQMSLKKCENTTIGYPGISNGISGGERKRLAFAEKVCTAYVFVFAYANH